MQSVATTRLPFLSIRRPCATQRTPTEVRPRSARDSTTSPGSIMKSIDVIGLVVDGEHCVAIVNIDTDLRGSCLRRAHTGIERTDRLNPPALQCPTHAGSNDDAFKAFEAELPSAASNCFRQPQHYVLDDTGRAGGPSDMLARTSAVLLAVLTLHCVRRRPFDRSDTPTRCPIPRRLRPRCGASAVESQPTARTSASVARASPLTARRPPTRTPTDATGLAYKFLPATPDVKVTVAGTGFYGPDPLPRSARGPAHSTQI